MHFWREELGSDSRETKKGQEVHAVVLSILFSTLCCCDVITGMVDGNDENAQIAHPQNKGDWKRFNVLRPRFSKPGNTKGMHQTVHVFKN